MSPPDVPRSSSVELKSSLERFLSLGSSATSGMKPESASGFILWCVLPNSFVKSSFTNMTFISVSTSIMMSLPCWASFSRKLMRPARMG